MSRNMHLVHVGQEQLARLHEARLVAAAVLIVFFTCFVVFAPAPEKAPPQPAVAASEPSPEEPR